MRSSFLCDKAFLDFLPPVTRSARGWQNRCGMSGVQKRTRQEPATPSGLSDATPEPKRSRRSTTNPSLKQRPALTLVFEHDDCGGHDTCTPGAPHQEAADRLTAVHRAIARMDGVVFTSDFEPATLAALQSVHSDGLIDAVRSVDEQYACGEHTAPRPLSPVLTERLFPENTPFGMTIVSAGTWR